VSFAAERLRLEYDGEKIARPAIIPKCQEKVLTRLLAPGR